SNLSRTCVRARDAQRGVGFIDAAVGFHSLIVLVHPSTAKQACLPLVTGFGVDLHSMCVAKLLVARKRVTCKSNIWARCAPPSFLPCSSAVWPWGFESGPNAAF